MRSSKLRYSQFIAISLLAMSVLTAAPTANAAAPQWVSGLFKSKKAAAKRPATINVPNLAVNPIGSTTPEVSSAVAQALANSAGANPIGTNFASQAAAAAHNVRTAAAMPTMSTGISPSNAFQPRSIANQSNDQYLATLLHQAQANPQPVAKFTDKFPGLRSDFQRRQRMKHPLPSATNAGGIASWLAHGTAAPKTPAANVAPVATKPTPRAGAVQVNHDGDVNGQNIANWANAPSTDTPADIAVSQAIIQAQTSEEEPIVPEQYKGMKIPGLPEDARIMSVEDRIATPAKGLGDNYSMTLEAPSAAVGTAVSTSVMPTMTVESNMVPHQVLNAPTMTAPTMTAPAMTVPTMTVPTMTSHTMAAPTMTSHTISQNGVVVSNQPTTPVTQSFEIPNDGKTPIRLTMEQIKMLPPGTRLIPANAAAVAALSQQHTGVTAPPSRPATVATVARQQPIAQASAANVASRVAVAQPQTAPQPQTAVQPQAPVATPPAPPTGPTQSTLVKKQLNYAFQLCDEDPAQAESEFVETLRYIAKAHDEAEGLSTYASTLERGLNTLHEAEQVQTALDELGEEGAIELAHSLQSDVSQSFSQGKIAASEVMDAYYLYARQSMMIAIGEQSLGSQALYGWGQLCSTRGETQAYDSKTERGKALALLTASVDSDKNNWRSHNEIGILHARNGHYVKSEKALRRSLAINPRNETYNNIAQVMDKQGKSESRSSRNLLGESSRSSIARQKPANGSAQVNAEQSLAEGDTRRDKVRAFVDRIMGTDSNATSGYGDDDGIPITAQ